MAGYQVELASDGKTALKAAKERTPDVVLTDVIMPEMDGFEVVRRLRADPKTAETAVIFVTARGMSADRMEGLALGADDYIVKPFDGPDLLARVAKVLQRARAARDESPLSGLPGHARVRAELDGRIQREEPFALLVSDLAGMRDYNDRYGFARGDRVLQLAARVDPRRRPPGGGPRGVRGAPRRGRLRRPGPARARHGPRRRDRGRVRRAGAAALRPGGRRPRVHPAGERRGDDPACADRDDRDRDRRHRTRGASSTVRRRSRSRPSSPKQPRPVVARRGARSRAAVEPTSSADRSVQCYPANSFLRLMARVTMSAIRLSEQPLAR